MVAISVLVVADTTADLRSAERRSPFAMGAGLESAPAGTPKDLHIDTTFTPVPLGRKSADAGPEMAAAGESEQYVLRGTIDSADIDRYGEARDGMRIFADPAVGLTQPAKPSCPGAPPHGTASTIRGLLRVDALQAQGLNGEGVAIAIVDTGINLAHLRRQGLAPRLDPHIHWSPAQASRPGHNSLDHGTMCAHAASIAAPQAVFLDFPVLQSSRAGGSVMDGFLSDAVQAYGVLLAMMMLDQEVRPYHALVINNSWGMFHPSWDFPLGHPGRYADNPDHPFNEIVGVLAGAGADILFAAGNCGQDCPDGRCQGLTVGQITGANSHPAVLSVAGNDIDRDIVGYSSGGPGALSNVKPDISAYTHYLGSEAFGDGSADGGTSTACPLAAGCIAALRTNRPPGETGSAELFDTVRATAIQPPGQVGWDDRFGFGVINPVDAAAALSATV